MAHAHQSHHHHRGPAVERAGASLLGASAGLRLAVVGIAIALIWAAVFWAMADLA